jgi:ABC-2 type transport system ATP-binding protein
MKNAVEVKKLVKEYNDGFRLGEIDLEIPSGQIIGLIGENGAGKTTLIKSLLGIVNIDSGDIKIFGKDYKANETQIKEDIGAALDEAFFPQTLNAKNINFIMKSVYKNWDSEMFFKYLEDFNIPKNKALKTFSTGMLKKIEIITALSHKPKLLILDEPTSGLDPIVRSEVLDLFLNFIQDDDHTILLSTHITSDLEHIADKIVFIDKGKKILEDTRDDIIDNYGILKCGVDEFEKIDKADIIKYKKSRYSYDILIDNKAKISKKYKDLVLDSITLQDLMVLMIKGEK